MSITNRYMKLLEQTGELEKEAHTARALYDEARENLASVTGMKKNIEKAASDILFGLDNDIAEYRKLLEKAMEELEDELSEY